MNARQNFDEAQRSYDARTEDYEPELPQIEIIDRAIDMLKSASRLYNQTMPKFGEADGTVDDAIDLLMQIPGVTISPAVAARWAAHMHTRVVSS